MDYGYNIRDTDIIQSECRKACTIENGACYLHIHSINKKSIISFN